jgi:hypothetical protein
VASSRSRMADCGWNVGFSILLRNSFYKQHNESHLRKSRRSLFSPAHSRSFFQYQPPQGVPASFCLLHLPAKSNPIRPNPSMDKTKPGSDVGATSGDPPHCSETGHNPVSDFGLRVSLGSRGFGLRT